MKKNFVLLVCSVLCGCGDNSLVGKCLPNERSITTTEQSGQIIETKITDSLLCGCFETLESTEPQFIMSREEFSFEHSYSESVNKNFEDADGAIIKSAYTTRTVTVSDDDVKSQISSDKNCDTQCTQLCKQK